MRSNGEDFLGGGSECLGMVVGASVVCFEIHSFAQCAWKKFRLYCIDTLILHLAAKNCFRDHLSE